MENKIRLAELLGSFSFAGDLGRGQPMGHVLRTTRIAMALTNHLRLPANYAQDMYYAALLIHAACTAGAAEFAAFLASDELSAQKDFFLCDPNNFKQLLGWLGRNAGKGQPLPARTLRMVQLMARGEHAFQDIDRGCSDVGSRIALRLGMSEATQLALYHICETWNGRGPHKLRGEDIPLAGRVVTVAMILEIFYAERGLPAVRGAVAARKGKSFDPEVADAAIALTEDGDFWRGLDESEPWESVLELEPPPVRYVQESTLDDFCYALADIVDLKTTSAATHSQRAAELGEGIARRLKLLEADIALTRRAALVHDIGLVGVPSLLLENGTRWNESDFERYRLHPYYTERILARAECLGPIAAVASAHHENVDGSGYHRGLSGNQLSIPARIVAAASAYVEADSMARAQQEDTEAVLTHLKTHRTLDAECLSALATEVGSREPVRVRRTWPAGLTEREVEVLRLVASGLNVKETAQRLVVSDHTARHHLENIYSKTGVSSRAGVVLFAVENQLLP